MSHRRAVHLRADGSRPPELCKLADVRNPNAERLEQDVFGGQHTRKQGERVGQRARFSDEIGHTRTYRAENFFLLGNYILRERYGGRGFETMSVRDFDRPPYTFGIQCVTGVAFRQFGVLRNVVIINELHVRIRVNLSVTDRL